MPVRLLFENGAICLADATELVGFLAGATVSPESLELQPILGVEHYRAGGGIASSVVVCQQENIATKAAVGQRSNLIALSTRSLGMLRRPLGWNFSGLARVYRF